MAKRLYKSVGNRMIGGVCGGLANYLNMDPGIVRIAVLLLCLFTGVGVLVYIAAVVILPDGP